jgi:hypothetical protein
MLSVVAPMEHLTTDHEVQGLSPSNQVQVLSIVLDFMSLTFCHFHPSLIFVGKFRSLHQLTKMPNTLEN